MRYPNRLDDVSIRMRRKYTQMGRVVKVVGDMLVNMVGHMLTDGITASEIRAKTGMLDHEVKGKICCFVYGTLRPHCRLVGDVTQAATFSRPKRNHGIELQVVVLPQKRNHCDLWGPTAGRRRDGYPMRRSRLNDRLRDAQDDNPT
ncbi:unnamed protein product [Discosporangium mesarthrocarpum]